MLKIDTKILRGTSWGLQMMTVTAKNTIDNHTTFTIAITQASNTANTILNKVISNLNPKPQKSKR